MTQKVREHAQKIMWDKCVCGTSVCVGQVCVCVCVCVCCIRVFICVYVLFVLCMYSKVLYVYIYVDLIQKV